MSDSLHFRTNTQQTNCVMECSPSTPRPAILLDNSSTTLAQWKRRKGAHSLIFARKQRNLSNSCDQTLSVRRLSLDEVVSGNELKKHRHSGEANTARVPEASHAKDEEKLETGKKWHFVQ